jgi:hypothetical protein
MSSVPAINLTGLFPGASPGLQDILKQLQQAQTSANAANEQRYQDILGLYSNLGKTGTAQIQENEAQQQAKATQDLTSRGLGNSTVTSSVSRGIANDAQFAQQALQEQIAGQKAGVMERRTDQGPNMSMYANLLQQASQKQEPLYQRMGFSHPGTFIQFGQAGA